MASLLSTATCQEGAVRGLTSDRTWAEAPGEV